ncbi:LysR family transcriptional regulator [Amaricoccus sp.]|uniref:LysR family transcriptional regulator n=1 Tax=Amaricoccus sp. TaxID=1872485 RepID=UPI001B64E363|nr:LysR family transcriptional regulator [Amaricoccus sp.]MBP7240910.1 LysR family transcriptional regulator [Amaricoccus sp.]
MDIDDLRVFVEVIEARGLTPASRRLGLSKSVVSRRLARLEAELAAPLVARSTHGVAPTEAGAAFKAHADRILAELDAGREEIRRGGGEIAGRLRVSAPLSFLATHLATVLPELALRWPRLDVHAAYSDRVVDLIGEGFDAAIRVGSLPDSTLVARRIAPVRAVLVASPAYLRKNGTPGAVADLRAHAILAQVHETWRFREGRREITLAPQARFLADSGPALLAAARLGLGVARLPAFLCRPAIEAGELVRVLPDHAMPEVGLFVVRPPPADPAPARVRALIELLAERFAAES